MRRLDATLSRHGTGASSAGNAATAVMGHVAITLHVLASDEILKPTLANYAFEHHGIAAYTSLIAMAGR